MQNFISSMRTNKLMRILLVLLIALSVFALWAHHHEAGHGDHGCALCQALQQIFFIVTGFIVTVWIASVRQRKFVLTETTVLQSLFHGAILCNRAPPVFA